MPPSRIFLVGFMGAGKTRVGVELAERLAWRFIDLDMEIERAEKLPIREIFGDFGEPHFRNLERAHLRRISMESCAVIALGGGAYIDPENRSVAESSGLSVWLKVSFDNVVHRVTMDGTRPLFANPAQARRLYDDRIPIYSMARVHIATDEREPAA